MVKTISSLLLGCRKSGKTTFVSANAKIDYVSGGSFDPDYEPPGESTIKGDYGNIPITESLRLQLISLNPWTMWFALPDLRSSIETKHGFIVLIDSTNPHSLYETQMMLVNVCAFSEIPCTLIANKQDLPNTLTIAQLRESLHLGADEVIVPCVATDKESATSVLLSTAIKSPGGKSQQTIKEFMEHA